MIQFDWANHSQDYDLWAGTFAVPLRIFTQQTNALIIREKASS